jgi:hypothetical protein
MNHQPTKPLPHISIFPHLLVVSFLPYSSSFYVTSLPTSRSYHTPRRTVSQLQKRWFWVMPTGGMPETISTQWNSVTCLFYKMAARGRHRSFDVIASPQPVVFPLSWKVVFFRLWQCSAGGAIYWTSFIDWRLCNIHSNTANYFYYYYYY